MSEGFPVSTFADLKAAAERIPADQQRVFFRGESKPKGCARCKGSSRLSTGAKCADGNGLPIGPLAKVPSVPCPICNAGGTEWPPVTMSDVTWDPASGRLSGVVVPEPAADPVKAIRSNPEPVGRLVQLMQRFGAPISGVADCEIRRSAPEGATATSADAGRTRLSFVFAAPGEDGARPPHEFVPWSTDPAKAAFLARMAALYDEHGEPADEREDLVKHEFVVRWDNVPWREPAALPIVFVNAQTGEPFDLKKEIPQLDQPTIGSSWKVRAECAARLIEGEDRKRWSGGTWYVCHVDAERVSLDCGPGCRGMEFVKWSEWADWEPA